VVTISAGKAEPERRAQLTREQVVTAAIELANRDGIESIRYESASGWQIIGLILTTAFRAMMLSVHAFAEAG
jgi:hypothetical protein